MEILAIIPARGGSKSIPRKNIRLLAGHPLIAHTIIQARQSCLVNRVAVSTDDPEIAQVAEQYGAEVIWRPAEISGDRASSESALLHALQHLQDIEDYSPDLLVFLQCTSPLTRAADIDGTIQALLDQQADTALAVTPFHYFLWKPVAEGGAEGINHDKRVRPLRQEREPQYLETGAVYVMRVSGFLQARHRFFGKTAFYITPLERRLEIDDPVDFAIAEALLADQRRQEQVAALPNPVQALVFDFDGVFTDNRVLVFQDGQEAVLCDRGDGWGIDQLKIINLPMLVLSTERNPVVQQRCTKLGLTCLHGYREKLSVLQVWLEEQGIPASQVVYLGNDVNDLPCLQAVGCGAAVQDAHPEVLAAARIVLSHPGGRGAIRELAELILASLHQP